MTNAERNAYLTPGQVAAACHVSAKTVSRWAAHGQLPCVLTLGGHRRFRGEDVEGMLRSMAGEAPRVSLPGRELIPAMPEDAGGQGRVPPEPGQPSPWPGISGSDPGPAH